MIVLDFLQVRRNDAKMHSMWYHFVLREWPCRTEGARLPMRGSPGAKYARHNIDWHLLRPSSAKPATYLFSPIWPASLPPTLPRLCCEASMPSCAHKFVFLLSWRFAGQACASSSPSRDGSRNSDAGRFFCSGKALLGGWSAGCGLTGAWSVVGGVTAGAGAGGSRGRSVKPACCHATGSDDCCVASVYVVSSAAGGVERGAAAANGVTEARCADGWVGGAGGAGVAAGALLGVSMGAAAGS